MAYSTLKTPQKHSPPRIFVKHDWGVHALLDSAQYGVAEVGFPFADCLSTPRGRGVVFIRDGILRDLFYDLHLGILSVLGLPLLAALCWEVSASDTESVDRACGFGGQLGRACRVICDRRD